MLASVAVLEVADATDGFNRRAVFKAVGVDEFGHRACSGSRGRSFSWVDPEFAPGALPTFIYFDELMARPGGGTVS